MIVDSHCHLAGFGSKITEIVENARKNGVELMVNCPESFEFAECISLSREFREIKTCLGIYPCEVPALTDAKRNELMKEIENNLGNICGIGEIGLDFKCATNEAERNKMKDALAMQIKFANENNLAIVAHSRFAERDTLEFIESQRAENALMHWYTHSEKLCKKACDLGYYMSAAPRAVVDEQQRKVVEKIPMENLLIETDSPVPFNGENATPALAGFVAEKIAEIKCIPVDAVAKQTTKNAKKLFKI
jgi:TatD DNase family protein